MDFELILIEKIMLVQGEQKEYWRLKRKYGNATQQLEICKRLEKELKDYCDQRLKEKYLESNKPKQKSVQSQLFIQ